MDILLTKKKKPKPNEMGWGRDEEGNTPLQRGNLKRIW
jgi:hypothetical protein